MFSTKTTPIITQVFKLESSQKAGMTNTNSYVKSKCHSIQPAQRTSSLCYTIFERSCANNDLVTCIMFIDPARMRNTKINKRQQRFSGSNTQYESKIMFVCAGRAYPRVFSLNYFERVYISYRTLARAFKFEESAVMHSVIVSYIYVQYNIYFIQCICAEQPMRSE